jgi:hypothetical protein
MLGRVEAGMHPPSPNRVHFTIRTSQARTCTERRGVNLCFMIWLLADTDCGLSIVARWKHFFSGKPVEDFEWREAFVRK